MNIELDLPDSVEWEIDGRDGDDLMVNLRCTVCRQTATRAHQYAREWYDAHCCRCPLCDGPVHEGDCPEEE